MTKYRITSTRMVAFEVEADNPEHAMARHLDGDSTEVANDTIDLEVEAAS